MDNVVNPSQLLTPHINVQSKPIIIQTPELSPQLSVVLKPTESVLLNLLVNSNEDGLIQTTVDINGQKIPLDIKIEQPLKLEAGTNYQVALKNVSNGNLQLLSINGQKAENFILRPQNQPLENLSGKENIVAKPSNSLLGVSLQPIKINTMVDNIMQKMNIPSQIREQILSKLPATEINVIATGIDKIPQSANNILEPLQNSIQQLVKSSPDLSLNEKIINNIQQDISALNGKEFAATVVSRPSAMVAVLDSPFGTLLADTALKMPEQTKLLLEIKEVLSSVRSETKAPINLLQNLEDIIKNAGLEKIFPRFDFSHFSQAVKNNETSVINLLKIFEPLKQVPNGAEITNQVLQHLPSFNKNMLSNMHSFFKAAQEQDSSVWLGKEVSSLLQTQGTVGAEILSRLDNYVSLSLREGQVWRMVEIPFFDGSQIIPIKIAIKKDAPESKEKDSKSKSGVRFLVDTDFSKLGQFQFDGFSLAKERRFDLVIRTSKLQSDDFCSHIINLFKKSLYDVDYVGNIKINLRESFVKVDVDQPEPMKEGVYI